VSEIPDTLGQLAQTIRDRRGAPTDTSYTRSLLDKGAAGCAKKFGEEAVEFALATVSESEDAVANEAADVVYHLLVALEARSVAIEDVLGLLERRMGTSGYAEKAARKADAE